MKTMVAFLAFTAFLVSNVLAQSIGGGTSMGAGVSATNLTSGSSIVTATSYTTASIAPTANKLVIVSVNNICVAVCATTTPTVTGAGGTWTLIGIERAASNFIGVTMLRDLSGSPGSGILTIDFAGVSQSKVTWSVDQFDGIDTSGTHGSGAIIQFVGNTDIVSETSFSCTLAALRSPANAPYGLMRIGAILALTDNLTNLSYVSNTGVAADAQWGTNATVLTWTFTTSASTKVCGAVEIKNGV